MLTQGAALVLGPEQRAPLQLGYNMLDELIEAVREMCRRHHEAVASALCEQRLELIRYLGCSPGDLRHHDALAITAANFAQCHGAVGAQALHCGQHALDTWYLQVR